MYPPTFWTPRFVPPKIARFRHRQNVKNSGDIGYNIRHHDSMQEHNNTDSVSVCDSPDVSLDALPD